MSSRGKKKRIIKAIKEQERRQELLFDTYGGMTTTANPEDNAYTLCKCNYMAFKNKKTGICFCTKCGDIWKE